MQPSWWPSGVRYPLPPQGDPSWGKGPVATVLYAKAKKRVDDAQRRFQMLQSAVNVVRSAMPKRTDATKPQEAAEALAPIALPGPSAPIASQPVSQPSVPMAQPAAPLPPFVPTLPVATSAPAQMPTLFIDGGDAAGSPEGSTGVGGGSAVSPWLIGAGALALVLLLGRK